MQSFADLGVSPAVAGALSRRGIREPFAVQRLVIADVMSGRDVLVKSPTGSGKTLAFGIPLVDSTAAEQARPAALVLAPTRELACQIVDELRDVAQARALRICAVYGGVGLSAQAKAAARSHILVATPGRLEDLLARGAFTLDAIRVLVLDEADRMLDMGFRPAVDRIVAACPDKRQTLFFSATLDGLAGDVATRYTKAAMTREHAPSGAGAVEKVEHRFLTVKPDGRMQALLGELGGERELALVFVRTKRGADRLVKQLGTAGVNALAIHGNKSQRQRESALSRFESGHVNVLVATDVAARGIDVRGISHVINYDVPDGADTYVHRIGRTGRAGHAGVGITLVAHTDTYEMRKLADHLGITHGLGQADSHGKSQGPGRGDSHRKAQGPGRADSHGKPQGSGRAGGH
ncbi:MAG TPA: DEAD/DEAH box helicase, partial [Solirubrobacteraceae bacterium]|nr:DEAD/DEAH box helicase [Solirubrobacteraceae bacterium]